MDLKYVIENLIESFLTAGHLALQLREKGLINKIKPDNTPVSNGDLEVNKLILSKISERRFSGTSSGTFSGTISGTIFGHPFRAPFWARVRGPVLIKHTTRLDANRYGHTSGETNHQKKKFET